jgi:hypothetical protein
MADNDGGVGDGVCILITEMKHTVCFRQKYLFCPVGTESKEKNGIDGAVLNGGLC